MRGTFDGDSQVFRGIPYAAPPVAELRFRPPEPPAAWDEVRDATTFGDKCPQPGIGGLIIGDEDCLTLNVWRPSTLATEPRPVLLFIHGGANIIGSGSDPYLHGRRLAEERDLVVVTINYRLGLLGFLAHPTLTAESGSSGNWAYLDQIAALQWVSRNIAAFGGDPERVTIAGESAGGLSVCVLLASPLAAGLFDAAIIQSGGCDVAPLEQREREGERMTKLSGCAPAADPVDCLRGVSAARLVELAPLGQRDVSKWALTIGGAVDGRVLPASPWAMFAAGTHNVVPTLVGSNAHETEIFIPDTVATCSAYELAVRETFDGSADDVLTEYPCSDDSRAREIYVQATTDAIFGCQTRRILRGLAARQGSIPLFRYHYAYARADPTIRDLRAFHASEVQLLFGHIARLGYRIPESERTLVTIMQTSWANMAALGSPIHEATPGWQPYDPARDNAMIFDSPVSVADRVGNSHCDFWDARTGDQSGNR